MDGYLSAFLAFAATIALILVLLPLSHRIGVVDHPGGRKDHHQSTPLIGGIAIFCGFMFGVLLSEFPLGQFRAFFFAGAMVVLIGLLDDLHEIPPSSRFVAQILAMLVMVFWGGVQLHDLGSLFGTGDLSLGWLAIPFTIFCGVGVVNSANMIDGLDGLAGGMFLMVFLVLAVLTANAGLLPEAQLLLICSAVVLAFLLFNFRFVEGRHAKTFLGDAGSLFLGLTATWFIIKFSQGPDALFRPITGVWLLGLPIIDTLAIMTRRVLRGHSPFSPDREHFHHVLIANGFSVRMSVMLMLLFGGFFMLLGLLGETTAVPEWIMFYGFIAMFSVYYVVMDIACRRNKRIQSERAEKANGY